MLTVNLHSDFLATAVRRFKDSGDCSTLRQYRERFHAGSVNAAFCAIGGDTSPSFPSGYRETLESLRLGARLLQACGELSFRFVQSSKDIDRARDSGSLALVLGLEGGSALEGRIELLESLHREGLRWLGLTWNVSNELGDGCGETRNGGLTTFGKRVIEAANRLGIVIDLAHASPTTFKDAAAVCDAPFIVSHSNADSVCSHPRNLSDAQIEAVAQSGGVVGINFFPRLLSASRPPAWEDIQRHVQYVADLVGSDHVALGPDFVDVPGESILEELARSGVDYGTQSDYPIGFSDVSCFSEVGRRLIEGGMTADQVREIMGQNVLRVMRDVEQRATLSESTKGPVMRS